jgi:hypothetical protein
MAIDYILVFLCVIAFVSYSFIKQKTLNEHSQKEIDKEEELMGKYNLVINQNSGLNDMFNYLQEDLNSVKTDVAHIKEMMSTNSTPEFISASRRVAFEYYEALNPFDIKSAFLEEAEVITNFGRARIRTKVATTGVVRQSVFISKINAPN